MQEELLNYAGCDGLIGKRIFTSEKDFLKAINSQEIHNRINYYFNHLQTLAHTKLFGEKE